MARLLAVEQVPYWRSFHLGHLMPTSDHSILVLENPRASGTRVDQHLHCIQPDIS